MRKLLLQTVLVCSFAFLGGVVSDQLLRPRESFAQADLAIAGKEAVKMYEIFRDSEGHKRIDLDASKNFPLQDFYGEKEALRLQMGTYPGKEDVKNEAGLPFISLTDRGGRVRLLLRLAYGKNESPIMVMKDTKGKDRLLLGLNMNSPEEEPFLTYYDKFGVKHNLFGGNSSGDAN